MLLILVFVFLGICYLCAESHLNNMNLTIPPEIRMLQFHAIQWSDAYGCVVPRQKVYQDACGKACFLGHSSAPGCETLTVQTSLWP